MTDWVCKTCGTINEDVLDKALGLRTSFSYLDKTIKEQERKYEYELRGELPKFFCSTCNEERIQGCAEPC